MSIATRLARRPRSDTPLKSATEIGHLSGKATLMVPAVCGIFLGWHMKAGSRIKM
jgi:hypothetical protein